MQLREGNPLCFCLASGLMMTIRKILCVSALWMTSSAALAVPSGWGNDITIYDQNSGGTNSWYNGSTDSRVDQNGAATREDNEVEPGMARNQAWDAEGVFQNRMNLTFVGGFNMYDGYMHRGDHYTAGDVFIDIDGDAQFGDVHDRTTRGNKLVQNNYGYDYVMDVDWDTGKYKVYSLDSESYTVTAGETDNQGSNPWQYIAELSDDVLVDVGRISGDVLTDEEVDEYFTGGDHYTAEGFDLGFLGNDQEFWFHWTMSCGNDNLMGQGVTNVPEPSTIALFGLGLLGLGAIRRKQTQA